MVFVFVWFTSFGIIISRFIHVDASGIISFLWLSNIPFCMHVYVCVCVCVCVCICLIHSSDSGHLDCFHVLAIINSAAKINKFKF